MSSYSVPKGSTSKNTQALQQISKSQLSLDWSIKDLRELEYLDQSVIFSFFQLKDEFHLAGGADGSRDLVSRQAKFKVSHYLILYTRDGVKVLKDFLTA